MASSPVAKYGGTPVRTTRALLVPTTWKKNSDPLNNEDDPQEDSWYKSPFLKPVWIVGGH